MPYGTPPKPYRQTPNGPFWFSYQFDGVRKKIPTGLYVLRDAERMAKAAWEKARAEAHVNKIAQGRVAGRSKDMTLDYAIGIWWDAKGYKLKGATEIHRRLILLKDGIGANILVTKIDKRVVLEYREIRDKSISAKTRKLLSPVTVNGELGELQRILTFVRDHEEVPGMPRIPWGEIKHPEQALPTRDRYLTAEEAVLLLEHIRPDYRPIIEFALAVGLRLRNLVGLTWADVNWHTMAITCIQKGGRSHVVPMADDVANLLRGEERHKSGPKSNVFTFIAERTVKNPKTGRAYVKGQRYPITYCGLSSTWQKFAPTLDRLGIGKVLIHDLRRTCTSDFVMATSLEMGSKFVGHRSTKVTEKVYVKIPRPQIAAANRITAEVRRKNREAAAIDLVAKGVLKVS